MPVPAGPHHEDHVVLLRALHQSLLVGGYGLDDFAFAPVHDDVVLGLAEGVEAVILHRGDVDDVGFGEFSELFYVPFQQGDTVLELLHVLVGAGDFDFVAAGHNLQLREDVGQHSDVVVLEAKQFDCGFGVEVYDGVHE